MRLDQSQQLNLRQEMKLAPRIIQAMEILQLPMLALQERIDAELVANPVLEIEERREDDGETLDRDVDREWGESQMVVDDGHGNREDFRRLDDMSNEYGRDFDETAYESAPRAPRGGDSDGDAKLEAMANTAAPGESLTDYLHGQWMFVDGDDPDVRRAGDAIIDSIDADGYFRVPLDELAGRGEPPLAIEALRQALPLIQQLEPTGVGARDLRECLLIQLDALAAAGRDVHLPRELVRHFLREIEMNRLPAIARKLDRPVEDIKDALVALSRLNPKPGLDVRAEAAPIVHPDVIVQFDDDGNVLVSMADDHLPPLVISDYYAHQARDRAVDTGTRKFLQRNLRNAQWILEAVQQRRQTIRRVAEEIFKVQKDFLTEGSEALKPLPMADVAEKVGVHVATVSRAVSDKYAQTPRGIFPLRMFFSGGTKTAEGEAVSWGAVKAKLQEIVDGEDKSKPLNDEQLAKALQAEGVKISRRTVVKYRDQLGIPTARKRKEY